MLSLLVTWGVMSVTGMSGLCRWAAMGLLFLCATQLSVSLINWLSTFLVAPQRLPRLDFATGIPSDCATFVVVPTMLTGTHGIERLLEDLEVRYLANRDEQLRFGLLTDFCDAKTAERPMTRICCNWLRRGRVSQHQVRDGRRGRLLSAASSANME